MDISAFAQNVSGASSMENAFSPTFGNLSFQIDPPGLQGHDIANNFPYIPYVSVEALFYEQMASNPLFAPHNALGGSNTGQQVLGGQITQQDQNGISRFQQGYQTTVG